MKIELSDIELIYLQNLLRKHCSEESTTLKKVDNCILVQQRPLTPKECFKSKIIGYKLKNGCERFRSTIIHLLESREGYSRQMLLFSLDSKEDSDSIKYIKEAGVLDLWFEPVYEEKEESPSWGDVRKDWIINHEKHTLTEYLEKYYQTPTKK